ncbi:MAG: RNA-binding transcriptional accessory protein [Defluviitaleaceae bacterium]|nr:RNA-binding transcriptional accessory protein [Defluviitaleaceae bacterium]
MDIIAALTTEFSLALWQVENTVKLIDEGNTIPFIARYRKEMTGSMDDQQLRELYDRLNYLRNLEERKEQVLHLLEEQNNLTDEIKDKLIAATTLTEVEDIYRPFRPKRRTRATMAEEKGLGPLADILWAQELKMSAEEAAVPFIDIEKGVETASDAIAGACDIIAERVSDDPNCRAWVRNTTWQEGFISSTPSKKAQEGSENSENNQKSKKVGVYDMYFEFTEPIKKIAGHRVLALNRGEKEDWLKVTLEAPIEKILTGLENRLLENNPHTLSLLKTTIADSYKRLSAPAVERELRSTLTEQAEEGAIKVFGENLRQLLMQSPIKDRVVLAIDPGFRTGCKLAVVDETGKVLETGVVYCTIGKETGPSKKILHQCIEKYNANLIAIGNGTASRETEQVIAELLKEFDLSAQYIIVNEAGASVYSASKLGAEEFPNFDVALRSAVSIGRRLQDPLAELVKIDPKSIGVGQYQHDMNQKRLGETLSGVVESCVNSVGVDLNTASPSLLSYVAGITPTVAKHILAYREENGKFTSRKELLKVKKLGPKAFEQCAGFLRIPGAANSLDNTGVHPESYAVAEGFLAHQKEGKSASLEDIAKQLSTGLPTLQDIIKELEKPGRDPREDLPPPILRSDVLSLDDLQEGMILQGTVRNVIDFGAFVDIGVHQDGLVHISQLSDKFIKHPLEAVSVGDVVTVKLLSVDIKRNRISLSMKI